MADTEKVSGSCLCGAVSIEAPSAAKVVGVCHCSMCRTWGGGPYLAVDCQSDVVIDGKENITAYNSSQWADRAFCSKCGTHLYYYLKPKDQYMMTAGFLNLSDDAVMAAQIFIDEKPNYYCFAEDTPKFTGEEFMKMMAGE
ncbi:GFA family protein [Sessilibacter sp. MAH1]